MYQNWPQIWNPVTGNTSHLISGHRKMFGTGSFPGHRTDRLMLKRSSHWHTQTWRDSNCAKCPGWILLVSIQSTVDTFMKHYNYSAISFVKWVSINLYSVDMGIGNWINFNCDPIFRIKPINGNSIIGKYKFRIYDLVTKFWYIAILMPGLGLPWHQFSLFKW